MKTHFEVVSIVEHDDGTADVTLEMDIEMLKIFASIGLLEVFRSKAMEVMGGHSDAEGDGNENAGAGGDTAI